MKVFTIFLNDIHYGQFKEVEDYFLVKGNIFVVADGVTRDPLKYRNFAGKTIAELLKYYPQPSPARIAAEKFCQKFISYLNNRKKVDAATIKKAFIFGNNYIQQLNKRNIKKVDYLINDYWACVASGGVIVKNKLYWGGIGDCGLIVWDRQGKIKWQTPNWLKPLKDYLKWHPGDWAKPSRRKWIRSKFRNKLGLIIKGQNIAYGVLTGEKTAKHFIYTGEIDLKRGDTIIFYSDGCECLLRRKEFIRQIKNKNKIIKFAKKLGKLNYKKYGHERTLVVIAV
jgi:serine/threonine protein phosphatase PrpC